MTSGNFPRGSSQGNPTIISFTAVNLIPKELSSWKTYHMPFIGERIFVLISKSYFIWNSQSICLDQSLIMENPLSEAITPITYIININKKKPTFKRLMARINSPGAHNWDESVVKKTVSILRAKGIINENYKILTTSDTNILPSEDKLLKLI